VRQANRTRVGARCVGPAVLRWNGLLRLVLGSDSPEVLGCDRVNHAIEGVHDRARDGGALSETT
jgi:hypothetical protein